MIVEQLYTGCLAEAAYYISEESGFSIDPVRAWIDAEAQIDG